jgi:two-component system chemotaxis response regulator CheY
MARILIVDDSGYARRIHRGILEAAGHTVTDVSTGMGALESYSLEHPDLVLLDLSMEDLGGVQVLKTLREMDAAACVVVVSADIQRTTEQTVMANGARRFLAKPVSAETLVAAVTELATETAP